MFHNFLHLTNIFRIIIFGVVFYGTVWSLQYKRFPAKTFQSIFTWPQNITPNFSQLFAANWASILKSRSHLHSSLIVFYHDIEKLKSVLKAKSSHLIFIFKWMQYLKKSLLSCDEIFAAAVCFFLFYFMNCLLIFVELNHIKRHMEHNEGKIGSGGDWKSARLLVRSGFICWQIWEDFPEKVEFRWGHFHFKPRKMSRNYCLSVQKLCNKDLKRN